MTKEKIVEILNSKPFIWIVRGIGRLIWTLITIDILFFEHKYICQTFLAKLPFVCMVFYMADYKIDYKGKPLKERLLLLTIDVVQCAVLFYYWFSVK